jgi:hypothetical protein
MVGWEGLSSVLDRGRPAFSDFSGTKKLEKSVALPGQMWRWEGDWVPSVDLKSTDGEGWSYAVTWAGVFTKNHRYRLVRRRKWTRTCVVPEMESDSEDLFESSDSEIPRFNRTSNRGPKRSLFEKTDQSSSETCEIQSADENQPIPQQVRAFPVRNSMNPSGQKK